MKKIIETKTTYIFDRKTLEKAIVDCGFEWFIKDYYSNWADPEKDDNFLDCLNAEISEYNHGYNDDDDYLFSKLLNMDYIEEIEIEPYTFTEFAIIVKTRDLSYY